MASARRSVPARAIRLAMVYLLAAAAGYCVCNDQKGAVTGSLTACSHITAADKDFTTFLQNHPTNGTADPPSQLDLLDNMLNQLDAAIAADPNDDLKQALTQTKGDVQAVQLDVLGGKPVTSAQLISDFTQLGNLCSEVLTTQIVAP